MGMKPGLSQRKTQAESVSEQGAEEETLGYEGRDNRKLCTECHDL
jgi:hypothetical protein